MSSCVIFFSLTSLPSFATLFIAFKRLFECLIMAKTDTTENMSYQELARKLSIASDPTRLQILKVMFDWREACVSAVAEEASTSVATASYHLNHMADNGYLTRKRDGQSICYQLNENKFVTCLQKLLEANL